MKEDDTSLETNNKKLVESIIQKWLILQKTIKEEITLEEVIMKHQEDEFSQLKDCFKKYYSKKLESRKIIEEIKILDEDKGNKIKEYVIEDELADFIPDLFIQIKNLLFYFRNNYDYIINLVMLISENDDIERITSLVELFCNQFYENILIPNPEQEELLLLIYKLFEKEIILLNSYSIDDFLNEDTFLGKFISSFLQRQELKIFLSSLINPLIIDIENNSIDNYLGISLFEIKDFIKNKKCGKNNNDEKDLNKKIDIILTNNIPKCSIIFKKEKEIKEKEYLDFENEEEDNFEESDEDSDEENEEEIIENYNKSIDKKIIEFNNNYKYIMDFGYFQQKINEEINEELKNLYIYELQQIINEEDIFSNNGLIEVLKENDFKENRIDIINKYKSNFIFIKDKIDWLIQSLIDKIESIPYTVRCICKLISLLLKKKFPLMNPYLRNSFIGKFIFEKYIFPILNFENKNVLDPRILSLNTKKCLNVIISILFNANRCTLFNYNVDTEKTIFNHYIIELIPIINKLYDKIIDIELPPVLDLLINNKSEDNKKGIIYNYFHEHNDELLHLQCICFSLQDFSYILLLIERNLQAFSDLPDFDNFKKAYNYIQCQSRDIFDNKIIEIENNNKKNYFLIFKDEKNSRFDNLIKQNNCNMSSFSGNEDSDFICKRFKFCIKTVLKGLNLLDNKDYSYLNMAVSNKKFFSALKYTLDDFGELSEDKNNIIPLKWYGQYIFNNKESLEKIYKDEDYKKIYEEIYNEESKILSELKSFSSIIITRDGMNIRCAENILQKTKYDFYKIMEAKEFVKIDKFIEEENIEVCFQINEINDQLNNKVKKEKKNKNNKMNLPLFITEDLNCEHKNNNKHDIENIEKNEVIEYHSYSIKDFINKFSDNPWGEEKINKYIKPKSLVEEDIKNGSRENRIYTSLSQYMNIVKKHIKKQKNERFSFNLKSESDCSNIANKIEDYIMRQIYIHVYPKEKLHLDNKFYEQTKKLYWITPEHLDIKKIYINQLSNAIKWIKKIDEAKSIRDKLFCISNAYNTMNNTIKFSSGKNDNAGQDELTPIFQYIIIQAQPQRILSNINYIKCFLDDSELTGELGFLLTQMESATSFIMNLDYQHLKITEEEFKEKINEAEAKEKNK